MNIRQKLKCITLVAALLAPGFANAELIFPLLDVQDHNPDQNSGADAGFSLVGSTISVDSTAFQVILSETLGDFLDVADETFTLSATSTDFDGFFGTFSGSFSAGSLLSGTFDNLELFDFGGGEGTFDGELVYTGGSLKGSLDFGFIEATFSGSDFAAKIKVETVPVPAAVWLFGSGLIGLVGVARRRNES